MVGAVTIIWYQDLGNTPKQIHAEKTIRPTRLQVPASSDVDHVGSSVQQVCSHERDRYPLVLLQLPAHEDL